jgi:hypothetical protein
MDVVTLARTARENLARGLGALQSPGVPPALMQAAEPIAQAMSSLHRIESTRGGPGADAAGALALVRKALSALQVAEVRHEAVDQAMEAIAGALGLVHQVTTLVGQGSLAPSPPTQPSSAFQAAGEAPPQVAVVPPHAQAANPVAATQLAAQSPWGQQPAPAPAPQQAWQQPAPAPQQGFQQPPQQGWQQPAAAPAPAPVPAAAPAGQAQRYEAELGAHSATNFYKGLSGNDVIDSGGIFIATYNIPDVGVPLMVKVCLPGGYEFEAAAVVRWTREAPNSGADSSPGFGAQFTQISAEGRQLVYRYVRNREPLFYDDL